MSYYGISGFTSSANSTTTPLNASVTFTGTAERVIQWPAVTVAALTDQDGTLYIDFSPDGTNWDSTLSFSVTAGANEVHRFTVTRAYVRVRFTNTSASNQTYLRLQTQFGHFAPLTSSLSSTVSGDADSLVVRPVDPQFEISSGKYSNYISVNKFGRNPDVDSGTVPEDVWNGGGAYPGFPVGVNETVDVFSSDANDTSAGTGARTIRIIGLDANGDAQEEDLTMNGVVAVTSVGTYSRVNRAYVLTAGSGTTNSGEITCRHTTTVADIFFKLPAGFGQTQVACYTIPAGYTGYLHAFGLTLRGSGTANIEGVIWTRESGGAVRLRRPFTAYQQNSADFTVYGGLSFPALTDLALRVTASSSSNLDVTGYFDIILIKD